MSPGPGSTSRTQLFGCRQQDFVRQSFLEHYEHMAESTTKLRFRCSEESGSTFRVLQSSQMRTLSQCHAVDWIGTKTNLKTDCGVWNVPFSEHRARKLTQNCVCFTNPYITLLVLSSVTRKYHLKVLGLLHLLQCIAACLQCTLTSVYGEIQCLAL